MVMGDMEMKVDLLIIGSGPGAYAAAFRGADLGLDVALVAPGANPAGLYHPGGCISMRIGMFLAECIVNNRKATEAGMRFSKPEIDLEKFRTWQKKIISDTAANLALLSEKRGIQTIQGTAGFENSSTVHLEGGDISRIRFKNAVIAAAAEPIDGGTGIRQANSRIMTTENAFELSEVPANLLVAGGGQAGLELGFFYAVLGSRIHLVEEGSSLLKGADQDLVNVLQQALEGQFEKIDLETALLACQEHDTHVTAELGKKDGAATYRYDRVLQTGPGKVSTDRLRLENTSIQLDRSGMVHTDSQQRTTENTIFAVGDICGATTPAHTAILQGKVAAEAAAGLKTGFDVRATPQVVYTYPQLAWCGLTEKEARDQGIEIDIVKVPWLTSVAACSTGAAEGLTKLLFDPETGRVLGVGVCGQGADGLISEGVLAIEMGAVAEDLAFSLHPHPNLSETLMEAAEIFPGRSRHTLPKKPR